MSGKSFWRTLSGSGEGRVDADRETLFTGRERHTHARPDNLGYPIRAIRDYQFLYNFVLLFCTECHYKHF